MTDRLGTDCTDAVLLHAAAQLPASPHVLVELHEQLLNPHLQLSDVIALLRRDSSLAGGVVKVANSVLFTGPRVGSVEDAVERVGLVEVFRVVSLATAGRFAGLALPCYGVPTGVLNRCTLLHALAAEALAPFVEIEPRLAYTAGLLRPLGMLVINHVMRTQCDTSRTISRSRDLLAAEREWVGRTNPEVAARVLDDWCVAELMVSAVREHYLLKGWEEAPRLAVALNVAGAIAAALGGVLRPEQDLWLANPAKLACLGLGEDQLLAAQEQTQTQFQRLRGVVE